MFVRVRFSFVLLLFTGFSLLAQTGQPPVGCATVGRSPWLDAYQAGKIPAVAKSLEVQYVPIHLTLVGDDNGAGYANPLTVLQSFEFLNEDFAKINVRFFIDNDIDYLNSTFYYDTDFSGGNDLMRNFNRNNTVNNYIVGGAAGACGYYSQGSDGIVLDIDCINGIDRTWSHEVGHFFSLPHTFYGWESKGDIASVDAFERPAPEFLTYNNRLVDVERVDGSNCEDAADRFCDTPPDYLPERWRCNNMGYYPDSLLDPDSTRFAVSSNNIMSYAFDGCVEEFSPEQITAMNTNLSERIGLTRESVPAFAAARVEDLELLSPAPDESVPYSNVVDLVWNRVPNASFYLVQLNVNSNFSGAVTTSFFTSDTTARIRDILQPNLRYYWRVRAVNRYDVSGEFSAFQRFKNGSTVTTATIDPGLDAAISAGPNPVRAGTALTVTGNDLGTGTANLLLFDAAGRQVFQQTGLRVSGNLSATVPTTGLAPGVYFLKLSLGGRMLSRRIAITP